MFESIRVESKIGQTNLSGVPKNNRARVKAAIKRAYKLTTDAIADLKLAGAGDPSALAKYEMYFGKFSKANYNTVLNAFNSVQVAFEAGLTVNIDNTSNSYAYVYSGGKLEVFLGKAFWSAGLTGFDSQGGVFVHELSHEVAGTNDIVYGRTGAIGLSKSSPSQATRNADNYEYYAE